MRSIIILIILLSLLSCTGKRDLTGAASDMVRLTLEDYPEDDLAYIAGRLDELALEYEGTPLGKELRKLSGKADDVNRWVKGVVDRAWKLNFALSE